MLQNASIQRLADPWPQAVETLVGSFILWGAQVAGFLLTSGEGTQWLLVGAEVGVLVGLVILRAIHPETVAIRRVVVGAAVLGLFAAILGGPDAWWPLIPASLVAAGFILRTFRGSVIYPAPLMALMFSSDAGDLADYVGAPIFVFVALTVGVTVWAMVAFGAILSKIEWDR